MKINANQSAELNGTAYSLTVLPKILFLKIHEVKLKRFQILLNHRILATNVTLEKVTNDEICTYWNAHKENIPICFGVAILVNVSNICE